jgi:hypothetical protein
MLQRSVGDDAAYTGFLFETWAKYGVLFIF